MGVDGSKSQRHLDECWWCDLIHTPKSEETQVVGETKRGLGFPIATVGETLRKQCGDSIFSL